VCGKGDTQRPRLVSQEEYYLRWALAFGKISREEFDKEMERIENGQRRKYQR